LGRGVLCSGCGRWSPGRAAVAARPGPALPLGQAGVLYGSQQWPLGSGAVAAAKSCHISIPKPRSSRWAMLCVPCPALPCGAGVARQPGQHQRRGALRARRGAGQAPGGVAAVCPPGGAAGDVGPHAGGAQAAQVGPGGRTPVGGLAPGPGPELDWALVMVPSWLLGVRTALWARVGCSQVTGVQMPRRLHACVPAWHAAAEQGMGAAAVAPAGAG